MRMNVNYHGNRNLGTLESSNDDKYETPSPDDKVGVGISANIGRRY